MVLSISSPYFDDALQSKFKGGIIYEFRFDKDRVLQYVYGELTLMKRVYLLIPKVCFPFSSRRQRLRQGR